ncbi:RDD family protein [Cohnella sp. WQ 127256]|uniref:RDD family protein n=1 Tax=Cohnella sp. WQ 127256 TaxID=2938790 RepID=UPI00211789FA|nr:RDD family protein [Cohnella sp. WQ 127256]
MESHINSELKEIKFIGFWYRVIIQLIDFIPFIPIIYLYNLSVNLSINMESIIPYVIYWIIVYLYFIIMISYFGGTLGKLIMKVRITDRNGRNLSIFNSIKRISIYLLFSIVQILIFQQGIQESIDQQQISNYINNYSGKYEILNILMGLLFIIDSLSIAFNKQKRAIHDFLAKSFVIHKDSRELMKLKD